jgi:class 3 adenylate cyclase
MKESITSVDAASVRDQFELHEDTIGGGLGMERWTMRFAHATVELDFVRFSTRASRPAKLVFAMAFLVIGTWSQGDAGGSGPELLAALVVAAVLSAAIAAYALTFLTCRAFATPVEEAAAFVRLERVAALSIAPVWATFVVHSVYTVYPMCDERRPAAGCRDGIEFGLAPMMVIVVVLLAPRFYLTAAVVGMIAVSFVATVYVMQWFASPVDYAHVVITYAAYSAAYIAFVAGVEANARRHFRRFVRAAAARQRLADADAMCRALLRSALPPEMLEGGAALRSHRSGDAAVCVADIHGFAEWSTQHLPADVVSILHALLTTFDRLVPEHPGVVRAMTYGDSFVTCAGLLTAVEDPAAALVEFAEDQLDTGRRLSALLPHAIALRASVACGALVGGAVGDTATHFVVVGPALDAALAALPLLGPNCMQCTTIDAASPMSTETSEQVGLAAAATDADSGGTEVAEPSLGFSRLWLAFDDAEVQRSVDSANARQDAESRLVALVLLFVSGGYLLILLVEQAQADPWRHHAADTLSWVLLPVAVAASAALVALRLASAHVQLPSAADNGLAAVAIAAVSAAACFGECQFVRPRLAWISISIMPHFRRLPWISQVALMSVLWFVPWGYYRTSHPNLAHTGRIEIYASIALIPVIWVAVAYFNARNKCVQHVAAFVADSAARAAEAKLRESDALLDGVLPAYCVPYVAPRAGATAAGADREKLLQPNRAVSALLCALHPAGGARSQFASVAAVWHGLPALVAAVTGKLMQIVEATGDQCLIAGPFVERASRLTQVEDDERRQATAVRAVELLRALSAFLRDKCCTFTAVAAAGSSTGALLGASLLSYRLMGPAIREGRALLAAAPRPLTPASIAFASDGFVRQRRNFVPRPVADGAAPATAALAMSAAGGSWFDKASGKPSSGNVDSDHASTALPEDDGAVFAAQQTWRVRGVGVTMVRLIKL